MYVITINGKTHRYRTFVAANKVANAIFDATGIVVGIERDDDGPVMGHVPCQPEPVRFANEATARAYGVTDYWPAAGQSIAESLEALIAVIEEGYASDDPHGALDRIAEHAEGAKEILTRHRSRL